MLLQPPRELVRLAIESPRRTMWSWIILSLLLASTLPFLVLDSSTSTFLDENGPAWHIYQKSLNQFGGDEFIVVTLEAEKPFDRETLAEVQRLTRSMQALQGVRRVDSLATVPLIRAGPDGELMLEPALENGVPENSADFEQLLRDLRRDSIASGSLFSRDERVFAINVMLDENVRGDRTQIVAAIQDLLRGRSARASGVPLFRTAVNLRTYREVLIFVPMTLLCVAIVVALAFASLRPVTIPLAVGTVGSLMTVGAMSLTGIPLSLVSMALPSILLALGCAYCMHILIAAQGLTTPKELEISIGRVARPVALSGVTTAIGFLAMGMVRIAAIQQMALFGALGVATLTVAALSLAPALLVLRPFSSRESIFSRVIRDRLRPAILRIADRQARRTLAIWGLLSVVFLFGIFEIRVSTDIILWFSKGTDIRDDYEAIRQQLSGISPVNIVLTSDGERSVSDPAVLDAIDSLTSWLEAQPEIGKALAVTDPLRQVHRVFMGDDKADLPASQAMVDQYLMLLDSVEYMRDVISRDHRSTNIVLRVDDNGSDRIVALGHRIDGWWSENGPADIGLETTGLMYEFGRSEEQIAYGQAKGLSVALLAIGAVLWSILGSAKGALIALIPNAVPLVIAFGLMGLLGIPLDAATVCIGSLALGIAVDDTIHVMTRYTDHRLAGEKPLMALDRCLVQVLPALVFTTVAIIVGFAALTLSQFTLIRNLGLVTSGLVFLCLLADILLLPSLLLATDRKSQ